LLKAARVETDEAKRVSMYKEMQTIVHDDCGEIIPVFPHYIHLANTKLRHGPIAGDREFDGARIAERWWFA
jgi:peptide/nickel transport system substrate-binding protein